MAKLYKYEEEGEWWSFFFALAPVLAVVCARDAAVSLDTRRDFPGRASHIIVMNLRAVAVDGTEEEDGAAASHIS